MVYLVTGAAGFIGSRVAELILEQGHKVIGIDSLNSYYDPDLKTYRLNRLTHPSFQVILGDIEQSDLVDSIFTENAIDMVIHLAARAGVRASIDEPRLYQSTNILGTLNLLEAMATHRVKKMVLASTSSLYSGQPMPFLETLPVNTPISPYAATKKSAEVLAYTYHHLYGLDISVTRYFTVYGPAGRPDMMPFRFISWILGDTPITLFGDGSASRDFTYIDDIARGTLAATKPVGYEIFNIGGGRNPLRVKEIISFIEDQTGKKAKINQQPPQPVDMDSTWANIDKAKKLLDWEPITPVHQGFVKTIQWHMENQDLAQRVLAFDQTR
jgi:UDP-glucuronate 4-epimerase